MSDTEEGVNDSVNDNDNNVEVFRSPASDIEIPKLRQRNQKEDDLKDSTTTLVLDPLAVTKENMSTSSRRPADSAFTQQRLFGWQPILTPYNVLPVLFILGLIFVPLGVVFLTASMGIQEYVIDYTECKDSGNDFVNIAGSNFKMRNPTGSNDCELQFEIAKPMKGPVAVYYRLTNFYQNNRLYAKSRSDAQLRGEALFTVNELVDCDPLISPPNSNLVYYPCGLVANSYFSDEFSSLKNGDLEIPISSENIAWPGDLNLYKKTAYEVDQVLPPPNWLDRKDLDIKDGKYVTLPDLSTDERFMNWMKISGLPTFRKLYGRLNVEELKKGTYSLIIKDNYNVQTYRGTKSFVISTTNWAGGKNDALGIGFIIVGGLLLTLGLLFLVMFMMAPRKVGDVSYLSWYAENSGDPIDNNSNSFNFENSNSENSQPIEA